MTFSTDVCVDEFWNSTISWNTNTPRLTKCLGQVGLTLIPNLFILLLLVPFEIKYIKESTNKRIRLNRFNVVRYLICSLAIISNIKLLFDYAYEIIFSTNSTHILGDLIASTSNLFIFTILFIICHYHRISGIITSGVLFGFTLLIALCSGILFLDTLLFNVSMYQYYEVDCIQRIFFCSFVLFCLSCFTDDPVDAGIKCDESRENLLNNAETNQQDEIENEDLKVSPKEYCSFLSKITFFWYIDVIKNGLKREIKPNEVYKVPQHIRVDLANKEFNRNFYQEFENIRKKNERSLKKSKFNSLSLLKVILKTYWRQILMVIFLKTLADLCTFAIPVLMNWMISFISDPSEEKWHGFIIIIFFILASALKTTFTDFNMMEAFSACFNLKTALSNLVFKKAIKLSPQSKKNTTTGQIINLFTTDCNRFKDYAVCFVYIFSSPFQLLIGFSLLYSILGYATFAACLAILAIMMFQYVFYRTKNIYSEKQMAVNDERIKLINEVLFGAKIIKFYAYEKAFEEKVTKERNKQASLIKKLNYIDLMTNWIFYSLSPFAIFTSTIAVYIFLIGAELTPQKAFVAITIFNLLDSPISEIPFFISYFITIKVSMKRLSNFFNEDELENYVERNYDRKMALTIKNNAKFAWEINETVDENEQSSSKKPFELNDIELEVEKNSFTVILGQVGSGKSSLISAILGDMHLVKNDSGIKGSVNISHEQNICYVAQQAWIQNCSFKNNILFGKEFNQVNYENVIKSCALEPDLKQFEAGDETEIGEKGINLSGGQKQRVSLARACYSSMSSGNRNQIILLDDPLSAVDAHVGKHLCDQVLNSKTGILKDTTRVLITNQLNQLEDLNIDQIVLLKDGRIVLKCTYDQLIEMEKLGQLEGYNLRLTQNENSEKDESLENNESERNLDNKDNNEEKTGSNNKTLIEKEKRQKGRVQFFNHITYFKYFGYFYFLTSIAFMICENFFQIYARVYIAKWTDENLNSTDPDSLESKKNHILTFISYSVFEMLSNIFANLFIVFGVIRTIKIFHKKLLHKVLRSPMHFFDTNPVGRIINRFTKDIMIIDEILPDTIKHLLFLIFRLFSSISLIIYNQPNTLIFYFFIFVLYYYIICSYVEPSRQLRRYSSTTETPIYTLLSETINGLVSIRAYNKTDEFIKILNEKTEINNRYYWLFLNGNRFLNFCLKLLTNMVILIVTVELILNKDPKSAANAGILISYAIMLTYNLTFLVRHLSQIENNAISLERINEYCQNQEEDEWIKPYRPATNWPKDGNIEFIDYSCRYRKNTKLVLKGLNFKINGSDKTGVVGRTGAGKSTITLSLFRIIEPAQGKIIIDNIDISKIGLHDLRSKLSIIPQDPVLFTGTFRFNIDPFNQYSDKEVYESLEHAHLKDYVNSLEDGIQHKISEGGENLSVGQRQLVCLARALLRKSKILVLDEATASVDFATDELVQKTIRSEFSDCTIITIAHRLNSVLDSSKILVLEKGELEEYDSPETLLKNHDSAFYSMAEKANLV